MKKMGRRIAAFLLAASASVGLLTGCGETPGTKDSDMMTNAPIEEPKQEEKQIVNPLTGEAGYNEALLQQRPVAVMVNNIKASLPQSGISAADIIYELPVEGGITRLMAVYSDYRSMPTVGSVRSCRHDYVELALPLDAVYVHFGGSDLGKQAIQKYGLDDIDGLALSNTAFWFDEQRHQSKATEHCWYTSGELVQKGIEKKGFNMTMDSPLPSLFQFAKDGQESEVAENALAAEVVSVPMSSSVTATFQYNEATGLYRKGQYGSDHVDATTGEAVEVKNVFLMYTKVDTVDQAGHKDAELSSGTGYYLTGGKAVPVTFQKSGADGMIKVLSADGGEQTVTPGKSWFCVIPQGEESKLEMK